MFLFFIWILLSTLICAWAGHWNRSVFSWFWVSMILSPLVAAILLLIFGQEISIEEVASLKRVAAAQHDEYLFLRDEFMGLYLSNEERFINHESVLSMFEKLSKETDFSLIPTLKTMIPLMK